MLQKMHGEILSAAFYIVHILSEFSACSTDRLSDVF